VFKIYRKKDNAFDCKIPAQIKFAGNVCFLRAKAKLWGAAFHLLKSNVTLLPGKDRGMTEMREENTQTVHDNISPLDKYIVTKHSSSVQVVILCGIPWC